MRQTPVLFLVYLLAGLVCLTACQPVVESLDPPPEPLESLPAYTWASQVTQPTHMDAREKPLQHAPTQAAAQPSQVPPLREADRTGEAIYKAHPELTPVRYGSKALLLPTEDRGEAYLDRITFICDSPTYWLWPFGLLPAGKDTTQIWTGPEGTMTLAYQGTYWILDPHDRVQRPIREVVARHRPDILVIALGINGISFMDESYFKAEYKDLVTAVQAISPTTIIVLQSIYPITPRYRHWGLITNASISRGNSWILDLAEETGCQYLDTFSVLLDDQGHAKEELMMNDGLHPNQAGLEVILDYIRHHASDRITGRKSRRRVWPTA